MMMTLKKAKVAENDWKAHREVFLSFYNVKGTAKLNFFSLQSKRSRVQQKRFKISGPKFSFTWIASKIWSTFRNRSKH